MTCPKGISEAWVTKWKGTTQGSYWERKSTMIARSSGTPWCGVHAVRIQSKMVVTTWWSGGRSLQWLWKGNRNCWGQCSSHSGMRPGEMENLLEHGESSLFGRSLDHEVSLRPLWTLLLKHKMLIKRKTGKSITCINVLKSGTVAMLRVAQPLSFLVLPIFWWIYICGSTLHSPSRF